MPEDPSLEIDLRSKIFQDPGNDFVVCSAAELNKLYRSGL
jgi:hypothetical protein